jgi:hypothetical protein
MAATLWHMAWWIAVAFLAMVLISLAIIIVAFAASQPPESAEEKERKRRYREEILRQVREQNKKHVSVKEGHPQEAPPDRADNPSSWPAASSVEEGRPQGAPPAQ